MANEATYPIATMCRVLSVSTSGYYKWRKREPSQRERDDAHFVYPESPSLSTKTG